MLNLQSNLISANKDVLCGMPVFIGTRVPVSVILERIAYGWTIDEVHEQFPDVEKEKISALLVEISKNLGGKSAKESDIR